MPDTRSYSIIIHSDILPLLDTYHTFQWLPQESLSGFKSLLVQIKLISPKGRSNNECQLHLGHISSDARPWAVAKGNKCILLPYNELAPYVFGGRENRDLKYEPDQ
jgi:hypothetical protein